MTNSTRTAAQVRSAAKDGKAQKTRRRAAWLGLPCILCGLPVSFAKDRPSRMLRTGENAGTGTIGHTLAHTAGGDYSASNTHPTCGACQVATGTRDLRGMLPAGPAWPSLADAIRILSTVTPTTWADDAATLPGREDRDRARMARYGF